MAVMMTATLQTRPQKRVLRLRDVAIELNCSHDTLARYIASGALPTIRLPSGRRAILREDLDAAIARWKDSGR